MMDNTINNTYEEQLIDYNRRFFIILEELKKTYPEYKTYINSEDYRTNYLRTENNMQSSNKDFFMLHVKLENELKQQNKIIKSTDNEITLVKEKNTNLQKIYNNLKNSNNGSEELASQTIDEYNIKLIKLVDFMLGIGLLGIIMYKV